MKAGEGSGERPAWGRSGWAGAAGPPRGRRRAGVLSFSGAQEWAPGVSP